jgi:predicted  nucleic acid-binding Zn-ribbon protein
MNEGKKLKCTHIKRGGEKCGHKWTSYKKKLPLKCPMCGRSKIKVVEDKESNH